METVSVLRRLVSVGDISLREARRAVDDVEALGVELYEHLPLLPRMLALRNSLTAYDACYVALAEGLGPRSSPATPNSPQPTATGPRSAS